jgi:hypothetical protein
MNVNVKHKWWKYNDGADGEQETSSIVDKFVEELYNNYGNKLIDWKFTTFRGSTHTWLGVMYVLKKDDKNNID